MNVADEGEVCAAMTRVASDFGRLDALVNNAGIVRDALLVKVKDGAVVGHLIGTFSPSSSLWTAARAELVSTFVADAHRGQGIGSRLVEDFVAWGMERGAARLHAFVKPENQASRRAFELVGFESQGEELVNGHAAIHYIRTSKQDKE